MIFKNQFVFFARAFRFIQSYYQFNPLQPGVAFLYPHENIIFWIKPILYKWSNTLKTIRQFVRKGLARKGLGYKLH